MKRPVNRKYGADHSQPALLSATFPANHHRTHLFPVCAKSLAPYPPCLPFYNSIWDAAQIVRTMSWPMLPWNRIDVLLLQDLPSTSILPFDGWVLTGSMAIAEHKDGRPPNFQACVVTRPDSRHRVPAIDTGSNFVAACVLTDTSTGGEVRYLLISIYTPPRSTRARDGATRNNPEAQDASVEEALATAVSRAGAVSVILAAGDFNAPHGPWTIHGNAGSSEPRARRLVHLFGKYDMTCITPTGTITCRTQRTETPSGDSLVSSASTIDLAFSTKDLSSHQVFSFPSQMDHYGQVLTVTAPLPEVDDTIADADDRLPRGPLDWEVFAPAVEKHLRGTTEPTEADERWDALLLAISNGLQHAGKLVAATTRTRKLRKYWTDKLASRQAKRSRLRQRTLRELRRDQEAGQPPQAPLRRAEWRATLASAPAALALTARIKQAVRRAHAQFLEERLGSVSTRREWQTLNILRGAKRRVTMLSPPFHRPDEIAETRTRSEDRHAH